MSAACVSSVLCTRVLVCKAQGSERGRGMRGRGRRSPVRDMPNCALATLFCAVQNALRAYSFVPTPWHLLHGRPHPLLLPVVDAPVRLPAHAK